MQRITFYQSLQVAISDQPETVAQIMYNSSYLATYVETQPVSEIDREAIKQKLIINQDKLRDMDFRTRIAKQAHIKGFYSFNGNVRKFFGIVLIYAFVALLHWCLSCEGIVEALKTSGVIVLIAIFCIDFGFGLEFCFAKVKRPSMYDDPDLMSMDADEFQKKYGHHL